VPVPPYSNSWITNSGNTERCHTFIYIIIHIIIRSSSVKFK
jgi:hypothetical protein